MNNFSSIMNTISSSDLVMVSASYRGRTIATIKSTGFNSFADVLRAIRQHVGSIVGLVNLRLRNASRGWLENRSVFIRPQQPGVQLTFQF